MKLPERFKNNMRGILTEDYEAFINSFDEKNYKAIRRNSLKISKGEFETRLNYLREQVAWCEEGYYIDDEIRPGKDIGYHCGLFYIQEPSASLPVEILNPKPGEKVLDLCAAPGGKTTQIGVKMKNTGVLVANDISYNRLLPLKRNIQLFGITNSIIVNENPVKLTSVFENYFDKILVDAPCSGEGMFRRDEKTKNKYETFESDYFTKIQKTLLNEATNLLKPDGQIVYSTCTFSREENEDIIEWFLNENKDFELIEPENIKVFEKYISKGLKGYEKALRIWPHKNKGDGHFAALLKRSGNQDYAYSHKKNIEVMSIENDMDFFKEINLHNIKDYSLSVSKGNRIISFDGEIDTKKLNVIYKGIELGFLKDKRFMPSQSFAMALKKDNVGERIELDSETPEALKYLKGETLFCEGKNGWKLVCIDGFPVGWGKLSNGILKNHYMKEWRMQ
jgi:NOL1/NOP2/sun family putative RNA methylase